MEYTATSFAEPLQRVFDDVLAPEHDVDVTHYAESRYLVEASVPAAGARPRSSTGCTSRCSPAARAWAGPGRVLANGSVHRYLGYGFAAVCSALLSCWW